MRLMKPFQSVSMLRLTAAFCVAIGFFLNLGGWPLFDVDEGAFSAATSEMLRSGNWITTYNYGVPRFDKPILIYWAQALSVTLFGSNEWAFRLPSALAAAIWAWVLWRFARENLGDALALRAVALLSLSLGSLGIARFASADALLNLWLALAFCDLYRYWKQPKPGLRARIFLWLALGALTKGPIGMLIPFVSGFLFYASSGKLKIFLNSVCNPYGWAILIAVAAPWYIAAYLDQGQAFIDGFIMQHNVGRFTETLEGHGGNWLYYLPALVLLVLPYSGLLVARLAQRPLIRIDPIERYCVLTFSFVFLFFSMSSTQLPHYLLYAMTPLCLLLANASAGVRSATLVYLPAVLLLLLFAALPELCRVVAGDIANAQQRAAIELAGEHAGPAYYAITAIGVVTVIALWCYYRRHPEGGFIKLGLVQAFVLVLAALPFLGQTLQGPIKEAALFAAQLPALKPAQLLANEQAFPKAETGVEEAAQEEREQNTLGAAWQAKTVVLHKAHLPSLITYSELNIVRRTPRPCEHVITRIQHIDTLPKHTLLFNRGGIVVAAIDCPSAADL